VQPSSTWPSSGSPCVILLWLEALEGPANTSIQNISGVAQGPAVRSVIPWMAANQPYSHGLHWHKAGGARPHVPHETTRVHVAARRRGSVVAARGAQVCIAHVSLASSPSACRISEMAFLSRKKVWSAGTTTSNKIGPTSMPPTITVASKASR
jgi:hypothetical protein